jgi:hypothetical protein
MISSGFLLASSISAVDLLPANTKVQSIWGKKEKNETENRNEGDQIKVG